MMKSLKLLRSSKTLFLVCSLFVFSCKTGPKVEPCLFAGYKKPLIESDLDSMDYENLLHTAKQLIKMRGVCVDKNNQKKIRPYWELENYWMLSGDDAKVVIDYCKLKESDQSELELFQTEFFDIQ